jgi:hypothetical protein
VRAGHDQLRATRVLVDLNQQHLDALARPVALGRNLLTSRHDRLGLVQFHDNGARIRTLHGAVEHLALLVVVLLVNGVPLVVADTLQH